jgi:hypothetical protein
MDDTKFWLIIEDGWKSVGGKTAERSQLAKGALSDEQAEAIQASLDDFVASLHTLLVQLPAKELESFDRILERKLYDIDRAEIQEHTDGSDDGFLYARGFIVAAGQAYYDAVNINPSVAKMDWECEEMCYISWHLYAKKFGKLPASGISRESCTNKKGWPDLN